MKKIAVLFGLFLVLLSFVYFYEIRGVEDRAEARVQEASLLRLSPADITSFDIDRRGQPLLRIVRQDEGWRIQEPVESEVDQFVVDAFLRDATAARRERTLEGVTDRLAEYGLKDPRMAVTLRAGQDRSLAVRVGADDFSGNRLYAQLDEQPQVFITAKALFTSADKDLREWRSKSILDFDQDAVTEIEIEQESEMIQLQKQASSWRLVDPIDDRASSSEVSSLLSAIKYARIDDFLDQPDDEQVYGLDSARYRFRVRTGTSDEWRVLEVGKQKDGQASHFARDPTRPLVFTVRQSVVDKLAQEYSQYRDRRVVDLKQDGFDELSYRHGEVRFKLVREGAVFRLVEPDEQAGQDTSPYKFWYPIQDLNFESIEEQLSPASDPRFAQPVLTLEFRIGVEIRIFEFAEVGGTVWARQANSGRAGTVSLSDFQKIHLTAKSIANPVTEE